MTEANDAARPHERTPPSLVDGLAAGEHAAWERFVLWVGPLIQHWCRSAGLSTADREDVCQEVFIAVSKSLSRFRRGEPGARLRGWLLGIVRHKIADVARQRIDSPTAPGGSAAYERLKIIVERSAVESSDSTPRLDLLRQALPGLAKQFEPGTWKAFWRTAVDGLAAPAVAIELGLSPAAVRKAKSRVLARLRLDLAELLESAPP